LAELTETATQAAVQTTGTAIVPAHPQAAMESLLNEIAPVSFVGRACKFDGKDGVHTKDDKAEMQEGPYVFHYPQTASLRVHFNGPGNKVDRVGGYIYDPAFVNIPRESLGETDQSAWPTNKLNGNPEDPWTPQMYLVLEAAETRELFTWIASNPTSMRAAGNLIRHCNRAFVPAGTHLPLIFLKAGGYTHPTLNIWVHTPTLQVAGRVPRGDAASTEKLATASSPDEPYQDSIPF
jgi:hypothetical protein